MDDRVRDALRKWKQLHVLQRIETDETDALWQQLLHFESWYPNGLDSYLATATQLFQEQRHAPQSTDSSDPFATWKPTVPSDSYGLLSVDSPRLRELEAIGLQHIDRCAFVVVAGGLGERLGYSGIKLALPVDTVTHTSYIETYVGHILALQSELTSRGSSVEIPLAIMTSDATHSATEAFLTERHWFNLPRTQLTLIKQDTVPCVDAVVDASTPTGLALQLVVDASSGRLVMKPHGHGDVHTLLHTSGLATQWLHQGTRFVHFIQDTNALILNSTLALLGATAAHDWHWAFTVVPRKAKDASGAIVQFTSPANATALFNVEYHELDQFLRGQFADGDTNDPRTGFSPFPGNINHFVAQLPPYVAVLGLSRGKTPEIFNPKYQPGDSGLFKSPARLECMMQDFPRLMAADDASATVGLLSFPSSLVYSPCKNDTTSAAAKAHSDIPPQCACSAEHDGFALNRAKLHHLGVQLPVGSGVAGGQPAWLGIPVAVDARGPHAVWAPSFGFSLAALASHFPSPSQVSISSRSTLVIAGDSAHLLTISSLALDGALRITVNNGARVRIQGLRVQNDGYTYQPCDEDEADAVVAMRGFRLVCRQCEELIFNEPGEYTVLADGKVVKASV